MNKPSVVKRGVKHLAMFVAMMFCLFIVIKLGLNLLGTQEEQIQILERWKHSPLLMWIRYGIYAFIIIFWKTFLKKINSKLSDETIKATYRPLIISLLMYEFLLARNLFGLLLN